MYIYTGEEQLGAYLIEVLLGALFVCGARCFTTARLITFAYALSRVP